MAIVTETKEEKNFAERLGEAGQVVSETSQVVANHKLKLEAAERQKEQLAMNREQMENQQKQQQQLRKDAANVKVLDMYKLAVEDPKKISTLMPQMRKFGDMAGWDPMIFDEMTGVAEIDGDKVISSVDTFKTVMGGLQHKSLDEQEAALEGALTSIQSKKTLSGISGTERALAIPEKALAEKLKDVREQKAERDKNQATQKSAPKPKDVEEAGKTDQEIFGDLHKGDADRRQQKARAHRILSMISNKDITGYIKGSVPLATLKKTFSDNEMEDIESFLNVDQVKSMIKAAGDLGVKGVDTQQEQERIMKLAGTIKQNPELLKTFVLMNTSASALGDARKEAMQQYAKRNGGSMEGWRISEEADTLANAQAYYDPKTFDIIYSNEAPEGYKSVVDRIRGDVNRFTNDETSPGSIDSLFEGLDTL